MSETRVASRYAKSLLELAVEKGILEEIHNDMRLFTSILEKNHAFALMLKNPIINQDKKRTILHKIFEGKAHSTTLAFFDIILRKGRENFLPAIAAAFEGMYNQHKGIEKAVITTPFPLTDALRKEFEKKVAKITGKKVILAEKVDPSLIGGYILKIGDQQLDDSVNTKLKALSYEFKEDSYTKLI
jgi:F-type H+-transporting ATPase subunit delta